MGQEEADVQSTGDGFLACFADANVAPDAAKDLGPGLRKHFGDRIQVCAALHGGSARVTTRGNRSGKNIHGVFGLQDLRHKVRKLSEYLEKNKGTDLILMTEAFLRQLDPTDRNETFSLGLHQLKGLDDKVEVFQWSSP